MYRRLPVGNVPIWHSSRCFETKRGLTTSQRSIRVAVHPAARNRQIELASHQSEPVSRVGPSHMAIWPAFGLDAMDMD